MKTQPMRALFLGMMLGGLGTLALAEMATPAMAQRDGREGRDSRDYRNDLAPTWRVTMDTSAIGGRSWTGIWRKQGRGDAFFARGEGKSNHFELELVSYRGRRVEFVTRGGSEQRFVGTLSSDGRHISGTFSDEASRTRGMIWRADAVELNEGGRPDDPRPFPENRPPSGGYTLRDIAPRLRVSIDRIPGSSRGWSGEWRREGRSNRYNANGSGNSNDFSLDLVSVRGRTVEFVTRGERIQRYVGQISSDGNRIAGVMRDEASGRSSVRWSAEVAEGGGYDSGYSGGGSGSYEMKDIAPRLRVSIDRVPGTSRGWSGIWRREGRSNRYNATGSGGGSNDFSLELVSVRGRTVEFVARGERIQRYRGQISSDGRRISGTMRDEDGGSSTTHWSAEAED